MLSIIWRTGAVGLSGKVIPWPSFACLVTPGFFIFYQNFRYVFYCTSCDVVTSDLERQKHGICVQLTLKKPVLVCVCVSVCVSE